MNTRMTNKEIQKICKQIQENVNNGNAEEANRLSEILKSAKKPWETRKGGRRPRLGFLK